MWHEARRQERKIRGMLVDYRRRAERRRDFYEKIKADPTQFLQIHARQCKIHLDPAIAAAADSPAAMMPWQGHADNLIDRFDVRAHLDVIPRIINVEESKEMPHEERQLNYERYRIIAQNSFLGVGEQKFLKQLSLDEQYGYTEKQSKKERTGGAAIGFNYEDGTSTTAPESIDSDDGDSEHSDSDVDVDLAINVSKMDPSEAHEMNKHGRCYGMSSNDFYSFLINDLEEAESYRLAKEEEHEKALYSGRKSRRERRAHREKRLANRVLSPPSYAARTSPTYNAYRPSESTSKSPSPENAGKITYITSFGDEEEAPSTSKPTYADKVKYGKPKPREESCERIVYFNTGRRRSSSSESRSRQSRSKRTRSGERYSKRSRYRSESKSYRKSSYRSKKLKTRSASSSTSSSSKSSSSGSSVSSCSIPGKSRSRSVSKSKTHSKSRSRSKSGSRSKTRSRSKSRSQTKSGSRSESKSPGGDRSPPPPPKLLPRYYGRKKSDQSSSELSEIESSDPDRSKEADDTNMETDTKPSYGNSGQTIKKSSNSTVLERLKRKRQALLNKQFKADKIAEKIKNEREKQEQQTREDELREMAIKLRRRQREKRHANESNSSSCSSDSDSKSAQNCSETRVRSHSGSPRKDSKEPSPQKESPKAESSSGSDERTIEYTGPPSPTLEERERDRERRIKRERRDAEWDEARQENNDSSRGSWGEERRDWRNDRGQRFEQRDDRGRREMQEYRRPPPRAERERGDRREYRDRNDEQERYYYENRDRRHERERTGYRDNSRHRRFDRDEYRDNDYRSSSRQGSVYPLVDY